MREGLDQVALWNASFLLSHDMLQAMPGAAPRPGAGAARPRL